MHNCPIGLHFDQMQLGGAAAEQVGEQPLEVAVHHLERGEQPLARFAGVQLRGPLEDFQYDLILII
jgi:hypothetical protein